MSFITSLLKACWLSCSIIIATSWNFWIKTKFDSVNNVSSLSLKEPTIVDSVESVYSEWIITAIGS